MHTSKNGIELIKKYEGLYLNSYKCPAGVLTIGYGTTNADKEITLFTINNKTKITKEIVEIVCTYKLYDKVVFDVDPRVKIKYLLDDVPNRDEFNSALKNKKAARTVQCIWDGVSELKKGGI